eukprot:Amastigsp_a358363_42.p1 type:complete len:359 gc:universal Amastigsp_a358363_42:30-1106(+)
MNALHSVPYSPPLVAVAILEKDTNFDIEWVWTYPTLTPEFKRVLKARSDIGEREPSAFFYSQFQGLWHYEICISKEIDAEKLPRVTAFSVFVLATEFFPEKYDALGQLLGAVYGGTGDVLNVLQAYMKVYVKGSCDAGEYGAFDAENFDDKACFLAPSLKDLGTLFGSETVLLWAAMLMGKRIVVYSDSRDALHGVVRALPLLVWHKKGWGNTIPFVTGTDEELADLAAKSHFVVGVTSATLVNNESAYDLAINVSDRRVTVAAHAASDFSMGPFVQDLAGFLVDAANDREMDNVSVIKGLTAKTGELLKRIRSMGELDEDGDPVVTLESIGAKGLPPNLVTFLFAVARAEGLVPGEF